MACSEAKQKVLKWRDGLGLGRDGSPSKYGDQRGHILQYFLNLTLKFAHFDRLTIVLWFPVVCWLAF